MTYTQFGDYPYPMDRRTEKLERAARLKQARSEAGFSSPFAAAQQFRWNRETYKAHETGRNGFDIDVGREYARAFGVDIAWLMTGASAEHSAAIPLVSWVSAGALQRNEGVTNADVERFIRVADLPKGDWMALTVSGDSMNRIAPEGAVLIVNHSDDTLINDRYYVFALATGEATFKRYRGGPQPMLQPFSTNPDHLSIPAKDGEFYVVGRVRRIITDV
jgi:SOS-response transcriptional repressor LexA